MPASIKEDRDFVLELPLDCTFSLNCWANKTCLFSSAPHALSLSRNGDALQFAGDFRDDGDCVEDLASIGLQSDSMSQ